MTEPRSGAPDDPRADEELDEDSVATPIDDDVEAGADLGTGEATERELSAAETAEGDVRMDRSRRTAVPPPPPGRREREREVRRTNVVSPAEQAVHIDDRISKLFVVAAVLVFALIFLNAMLLGRGGALSPAPTPTPTPAATASPSASSSPSATTSPSASASGSAAASPSASAAATPTATP
jgi:hypothetical protein